MPVQPILLFVFLLLVTCQEAPTAPTAATSAFDAVPVPMPTGDTLYIDRTLVTVAQFTAFAKTAGYTTQAESFGNSGIFDLHRREWRLADSATYRTPFGKTGNGPLLYAPPDHPATQVSYHDAVAYCTHYHKRLLTEAEWETAARHRQPTGTTQYPWGDGIKAADQSFRANIWQGIFPIDQRIEDGYAYTSPVRAYPPAPSGLYDMAGNVWEWTQDTLGGIALPQEEVHRIGKGGSFLCEPSWCHGYLIDGRTNLSSESASFHVGFRCACEQEVPGE